MRNSDCLGSVRGAHGSSYVDAFDAIVASTIMNGERIAIASLERRIDCDKFAGAATQHGQ
jgi:hypothetical protein